MQESRSETTGTTPNKIKILIIQFILKITQDFLDQMKNFLEVQQCIYNSNIITIYQDISLIVEAKKQLNDQNILYNEKRRNQAIIKAVRKVIQKTKIRKSRSQSTLIDRIKYKLSKLQTQTIKSHMNDNKNFIFDNRQFTKSKKQKNNSVNKNQFNEQTNQTPIQGQQNIRFLNLRSHQLSPKLFVDHQVADKNIEVSRLNDVLRSARYQTLQSLSTCTNRQSEQICRVVYQFLTIIKKQKAKTIFFQDQFHQAQDQNKILEAKLKMLTDLQKQKERSIEKIFQLEPDFEDKEVEFIKESQLSLRQTKNHQAREILIKNQFMKRNERILFLEDKLKNMVEKMQNNDYKNSFQILQRFKKQGQEQKDCDLNPNFIQNSSQRIYIETLEIDNKVLKQYIREVVTTLLSLDNYNLEQEQRNAELNKYMSLLEIPHQHSQQFRQLLMVLLDKAKGLQDSYYQMKRSFQSCKQIEERKSKTIVDSFNLHSKILKLDKPCLQRMTNYFNKLYNTTEIDLQQSIKVYEQPRSNFQKQKQQSNNESIEYYRRNSEFLKKQNKLAEILQQNFNNLAEPTDNPNNYQE